MEPAPIRRDDVPDFLGALNRAFHRAPDAGGIGRYEPVVEPERSLAIRDHGSIVGTASSFTRRMTVPGGDVPLAAVTLVGVQASHRRRGLLTALMRRQLADIRERGAEAVAALWASEGAIYGRFGYGMASMSAELAVRVREAKLRRPPAARAVTLSAPDEARPAMEPIYEAARGMRPGMLDRPGHWWTLRVADPEDRRDGAEALHAAVMDGAYAIYAVMGTWESGRPAGEVRVREVMAVDADALGAIWQLLLSLDLSERLVCDLAPVDHPLPHMVTEAQAVQMRVSEALWLRLVDLPRALAERGYAAPFAVVLEVFDEICPWNAGRWALAWDGERAACERTAAPADLELGAADLGAAYLGGTTLDTLARAGRVAERRAGALTAAARAFRGDRAPWCPEVF